MQAAATPASDKRPPLCLFFSFALQKVFFSSPVSLCRAAIKRLHWINKGLVHMQSTHWAAHNSPKEERRRVEVGGGEAITAELLFVVCLFFLKGYKALGVTQMMALCHKTLINVSRTHKVNNRQAGDGSGVTVAPVS